MPLPRLFELTRPSLVNTSQEARAISAARTGVVRPEFTGAGASSTPAPPSYERASVIEGAAAVPPWMLGAGILVLGVAGLFAWKKWA